MIETDRGLVALPVELLLRIQESLADSRDIIALSRTCRHLRAISETTDAAYRSLSFSLIRPKFADSALRFAKKHGDKIRELTLRVEPAICKRCWYNCGGVTSSNTSEDCLAAQEDAEPPPLNPPISRSAVTLLQGGDEHGIITLPSLEVLRIRLPDTRDFNYELMYFDSATDDAPAHAPVGNSQPSVNNVTFTASPLQLRSAAYTSYSVASASPAPDTPDSRGKRRGRRNVAVADAVLWTLMNTAHLFHSPGTLLEILNLPPGSGLLGDRGDTSYDDGAWISIDPWKGFLGTIQHLKLSLFSEGDGKVICTMEESYTNWLRSLDLDFFRDLSSLRTLTFHASEAAPLGLDEAKWSKLPFWLADMPLLERLELARVAVDGRRLLKTLLAWRDVTGGSRALSLTLTDAVATSKEGWAGFFRKLVDEGIVLSELRISSKLNTPAALSELDEYFWTRAISVQTELPSCPRFREAQAILRKNPNRIIFEYGSIDHKYECYETSRDETIKRFLHGEDEKWYQRVTERIKGN